MGDLTHKQSSGTTRIVGSNEVYAADVVLEDGIRKLATTKKVQVDSLSGQQLNATNYFFVDSVADGQTLRIEIDATDFAPALDETFTVNVGETAKQFTDRIILELNQNFVNFQPYFKALDIDDNPTVYFISKAVGESGENSSTNSFRVTGTVPLVNGAPAFDDFLRRGTLIQASQSTTDPRLGVFGISGTVESRDASVEGLFVQQPFDGVATAIDLNVNGSGTPVVFTFPMDALDDLFISEIKFFGRDNGIQFSNFLGQNGSLTNGILVEIKTDNNLVVLPPIKTTDDFDDKFAFGGSNFDVYFASGDDKFSARFLSAAFPLRRSGAFGGGNDDYIRITIRDNLTSINYLQCIVEGFRQEA
jgi:hypothetical protein